MNTVHIIGAGGHGRVVYEALMASAEPDHVVWHDDAWEQLTPITPARQIQSVDALLEAARPQMCIVAIGNAADRMRLLLQLLERGHEMITVQHPTASVSPTASVDAGCVVMANAVIQTGAQLGRGVIVNTAATIDHDCHIGEGVHIAPGVTLAGDVRIGRRSWVGLGAVIREGVEIGEDAVVGAGAVVLKDVPTAVTVIGNPARVMADG